MWSKKSLVLGLIILSVFLVLSSFKKRAYPSAYISTYYQKLDRFSSSQSYLLALIEKTDLRSAEGIELVRKSLGEARNQLKAVDFWLRYMEPLAYKKINGPLPVEWETEVFEKFEKPYKREGAGLTLAELYLQEENVDRDSLASLIRSSIQALEPFRADSITGEFKSYHNFYLCNRLFLLNLAAIYTTGFECPDTSAIIRELRLMLKEVNQIYVSFNQSFPEVALPADYLGLYDEVSRFVNGQPDDYSRFDHFDFIKKYVNPLFYFNQRLINRYHVVSKSLVDYSLNKKEITLFNKGLYYAQNTKGVFLRVTDEAALQEIDAVGKLLFYDPILSGNNLRSCASCHKPNEYFTDTVSTVSLQYNRQDFLPRNTPTLINVPFNHLVMLDGRQFSLQDQAKSVITNPTELGCEEKDLMKKILSCDEYRDRFKALLKYTPQEKEISFDHIVSAITFYYSRYSHYYSPFDKSMDDNKELDAAAKKGFNLFMSKAQCATCHFVPQFNGVKPPFVGSEFEVLGVPQDSSFTKPSTDPGRYAVNPAGEMLNAFRTGSVRNASRTGPYMHNGVFKSLNQLIEFYNAGGGAGKGLQISNQTLSADSLKLSIGEKTDLLQFIFSLNEDIPVENPPAKLPLSKIKELNNRKIGGEY